MIHLNDSYSGATKRICLLIALFAVVHISLGVDKAHGAETSSPFIQATHTRIDTFTIEKFEELNTTIYVTLNYPQGHPISSLTFIPFWLEFMDRSSVIIDIYGGTCSLLSDNRISCNGQSTYLSISYRVTLPPGPKAQFESIYKLPRLSPPAIFIEINTFDTPIDYTLNVIYPSSFTYISSTIEPTLIQTDQNRLLWSKSSMSSFKPNIEFSVAGLHGIRLPITRK